MSELKTAAVLLIGDELLSGRTRDINLQNIAEFLGPIGIQVHEARVVSDVQERIVEAVNDLRSRFDYVFTTGGIGPTHDDITADSIAAAFRVPIDVRQDALDIISARYEKSGVELTPARMRMARIPEGAILIANPVSGAPGFQMDNVFVMAGVPSISRAMLEDVGPRLEGGTVVISGTVRAAGLREGDVAADLSMIAEAHPDVSVGSYPWYGGPTDSGVNLVVRGLDQVKIDALLAAIRDMVVSKGIKPT